MLMLLSALTANAEDPAAAPLTEYDRGVAALAEKDAPTAIQHFQACIQEAGSPHLVDCRWELGWAYWVSGDWSRVVETWTAVERVEPDREGLSKYLSQARDNLGLQELLAQGRASAERTFVSAAPDGATVRLRAVGDMMIGTDFPAGNLPPSDGATIFAGVADWLKDADLTFGNLEGPLCDSGATDKCKPDAAPGSCYAFRTPARYVKRYVEAGFDLVSTANNHAGDFGEVCRLETERHLDAAGIAHSGRPGDIASLEHDGLKVAMIGFHTSQSCHYVNDHETAAALVSALAATHDIVIVSFHGGAEGSRAIHVPRGQETFYGENRGDLRAFTHTVVDAGADLVIGHGPHVLRGMEVYRDRLIAYSLGNFATYSRFNLTGNSGLGVVLDVTLDKQGRFVAGQLLPTIQEGEGFPVKDPEARAVDLIRTLTQQDFPEHGVRVAQDGTLAE
jgi:poly-gamma-glutamate capsule biosynthesis protein CapA/YwtB (metallophosphatase superfamily)